MNRRDFLKNSLAIGSAAALGQVVFSGGTHVQAAPPHPTVCLAGHQARFHWKNAVLTGYCADPTQKHPYFLPLAGPMTGLPLTDEISHSWSRHRSMLMACDRVNGGNFRQGTLECGQIVSQGITLGKQTESQTKSSCELIDTCLWQRPDQELILKDKRRFRFTVFSDHQYIVDCSFELTPLVDLTIQATNHSLFSIRAAQDLSVSGGGTLVNSNGETNMTGTFGKPAKWCTFYSKRKQSNHIEGIAILCPPKPFENCPWFTRDYGFMSPTPFHFIEKPWHRQQGETLTLQYRVVAYSGPPEPSRLNRLWQEFAEKV